MSWIFHAEGETIWNPASRVGELYLRQADLASWYVGVDHAMTFASDEVIVDRRRLATFAAQLVSTYSQSNHPVLRELLWPVLQVSVVLAERAGQRIEARNGDEAAIIEIVRTRSDPTIEGHPVSARAARLDDRPSPEAPASTAVPPGSTPRAGTIPE